MAPEETQVSASSASGNLELSTPNISGTVEGQPKSAGQKEELDLAKELRDVKARLDKYERGEQSAKDRGVKKLETRLDDLTKALAFLDKLDGATPEKVAPVPETSPKVSKDEEPEAEYKRRVTKRLNKLGIPEAEHGLATAALAGKEYADWDEAVDEAVEAAKVYAANKQKQSAPASLAGASTATKVTSTHETTEDEAADEYAKLARGSLRDKKTVERMRELKAQLDKANPRDDSVN
jgi:hypothetical protein